MRLIRQRATNVIKTAAQCTGRHQWFWPHSQEHFEVKKRKALSIVSPVDQCRFPHRRILSASARLQFRSSVRLPEVSRILTIFPLPWTKSHLGVNPRGCGRFKMIRRSVILRRPAGRSLWMADDPPEVGAQIQWTRVQPLQSVLRGDPSKHGDLACPNKLDLATQHRISAE